MTDDPRIADLKAALQVADLRYEGLRVMYDTLSERYHALAVLLVAQPTLTVGTSTADWTGVASVIEEPDVPPAEVLAAIQAISPTRDKTYEANWGFWERNKDRAKAHPEDFAAEILRGAT